MYVPMCKSLERLRSKIKSLGQVPSLAVYICMLDFYVVITVIRWRAPQDVTKNIYVQASVQADTKPTF